MVHSMLPLERFSERKFLISNSKGFKRDGILSKSSNCLPLSERSSMMKILSFIVHSPLPYPVIDLNIKNYLTQGKRNNCAETQAGQRFQDVLRRIKNENEF